MQLSFSLFFSVVKLVVINILGGFAAFYLVCFLIKIYMNFALVFMSFCFSSLFFLYFELFVV